MKHTSTFILVILFSTILCSQNIMLNEVGQLNDILSEPSGIEVIYNPTNGHFEYWAHNDFENPETIYNFRLDDLMNVNRALEIPETYIDWEDMASDEEGNLYLGDFGNWVEEDELQIVKVPNPANYVGAPPEVEVIKFKYAADLEGIVEDIEAMFHLDDFLYFFTKSVNADNSNPTRTYCFKIPNSPDENGEAHIAQLMNSHQVVLPNDADPNMYKITAADISPDKQTMVLQCYSRIWVFSCFEGDDFFNGHVENFPIPFRQYEGITFINNHEVVITKEGNIEDPDNNPKVFHIDLHPWVNNNCLNCEKVINGDFENSELAWSLFEFGDGEASIDMSNGHAEIDISSISTSLWHINIRHKSMTLEQGHNYRISYTAYAEDDRPISVIANKADGSIGYFYESLNISAVPTTYTHEFLMEEETDFNSYLSLNVGREFAHKVFFDDISLMEIDCSNQVLANEEQDINGEILVFPNPFSHRINIQTENTNLSYKLYNNLGKLMYNGNLENGFIETSHFQNGLYVLVLLDQNKVLFNSKMLVKLN